jgi:3-methyladenine DNA glycosylase AlkD
MFPDTAVAFTQRVLALPQPVRMGQVFALAKEHIGLPIEEIDRLLDHDEHAVRVGALSVMDKQARRKRTPTEQRTALYDLYLRRHDRIDNWDLVDLGAPHVVGGYLFDKPREPLYALARSADVWERRTAIVATLFFVRQGEVDDTFAIAELLRADDAHFVQTAVGGLLREAGKREPERLPAFLDAYATDLSAIALRFAMEKLDPPTRERYRAMRAAR